jgi:serine/threonine protein kinase
VMDKERIVRQHLEGPVMAEKGILEQLRHPFVVNLHCSFQTPTKLCLVLDYHSGGTLQDLLDKWTKIPETVTRFYATEIALALRYLHSQNIIHRDLKTSNVLINGSGHAILSDFGIAVSSNEARTFCGTPHYLAPEVLAHRSYTKAVDWWCYGVALYHMLTGTLPFISQGENSGATVYRNILNDDPEYPSSLSEAAIGLLKGLLEKDPAHRYGFDALPPQSFFDGVDWEAAIKLKIPCPYLPDH